MTSVLTQVIRILVIDNDPEETEQLRQLIAAKSAEQFEITHVTSLAEAQVLLKEMQFDVILLDLSLPDSYGLETILRVQELSDRPIIVLTALDDEVLEIKAVQAGAQDYLITHQLDQNLLIRAVRYAIERHNLLTELRNLSLIDDLTGLYNRRGFQTLAEQQLKMANRTRRQLLLLFADLDQLKGINDTFGHHEGSRAIMEMSEILRSTFRESDIIARLGGDEFVVLVLDNGSVSPERLTLRLQEQIDQHNGQGTRPYQLSASTGIAYYNPEQPASIDELLVRADRLMYEQKRSKRIARYGQGSALW